MSKDLALEFLRQAERSPQLRRQLDAIDPRETGQLLQALAGIARDAGYDLSAHDLQLALGDWTTELLDDSELSRTAGGLVADPER